jgi:hypothetical protein
MSMLNLDGQLVASALLQQQTGDVITEILQHRREMKAADLLHQQQYADQQRYAWLVAKYNDLADRYNRVLADNKHVDAAHAQALAEKDQQIARLAAENERLIAAREESRRSAYEGWTKLTRALEEIERLKIKSGEKLPDEPNPNL